MEQWGLCTACAEPLAEGDGFCTACGAAASAAARAQICPKCGAGYPNDYRYCVTDGLALSAEAVDEPSGATPEVSLPSAPFRVRPLSGWTKTAALGGAEEIFGGVLRALAAFWTAYDRLLLTALGAAALASAATFFIYGPPQGREVAYGMALLPVVLGLAVGFARSDALSGLTLGLNEWTRRQRQASRGHASHFRRWVVAPMFMAPDFVDALAGDRVRKHVTSGISVIIQLYTVLLVAFITYVVVIVVVVIVLTIAAIWIGLVLLGNALSDSDRSPAPVTHTRSQRSTTRSKKDFWGEDYAEHRDDDGRVVAKTREKRDFWGQPYAETRNRDGDVTERTRDRKDFWGDDFGEHRDSDGRVVGRTREKADFWGESYQERRDAEGKVESTSREKKDFWGEPYTERKPKE